MLINLLCVSDNTKKMDTVDKDETEIKNKVLSICEDIVFMASRGRKMIPKHLGLGLALHQATHSKDQVNLFHAAAHTAVYETIRCVDTAIADDVIQRF